MPRQLNKRKIGFEENNNINITVDGINFNGLAGLDKESPVGKYTFTEGPVTEETNPITKMD